MSYLTWISDDKIESLVTEMMQIAIEAMTKATTDFSANVVDPFSPIFEMGGFNSSKEVWYASEVQRKAQKTLQNAVGNFHQKVLGSVTNWEDLGIGEQVDLRKVDNTIIAEIKNKFNTVTGGKLKDMYEELDALVNLKASKYYQSTAYFVNIIPSKPERFNKEFTPSDKTKGAKCPTKENIRIIDGASFYHLVTGHEFALRDLHSILPEIVQNVLIKLKDIDDEPKEFTTEDKQLLQNLFEDAFG